MALPTPEGGHIEHSPVHAEQPKYDERLEYTKQCYYSTYFVEPPADIWEGPEPAADVSSDSEETQDTSSKRQRTESGNERGIDPHVCLDAVAILDIVPLLSVHATLSR